MTRRPAARFAKVARPLYNLSRHGAPIALAP